MEPLNQILPDNQSLLPRWMRVALIITAIILVVEAGILVVLCNRPAYSASLATVQLESLEEPGSAAPTSPEPAAVCKVADTEAVLAEWQESFCQSFSEDTAAAEWEVNEISERVAEISTEVYRGHLGVRAVVKQSTSNYVTAPVSDLRDFMVSVEGRMSGYSGNPYHEWGMVLKESEDGYYIFKIDSNKRYYFQLIRGDQISNLSSKEMAEAILPLDQTNRLTVSVDNYMFRFYINGELADETRDNRLVQGKVGAYMKMGGNTTVDWEFDNFVIYTP